MAWAWPPSSLNRGGTVAPPGPGDKTCSCSPGCAVPRECGPQPGPPLVPRSALGRPAAGSIDGRDRGPGSNGANLVPDLPPALCRLSVLHRALSRAGFSEQARPEPLATRPIRGGRGRCSVGRSAYETHAEVPSPTRGKLPQPGDATRAAQPSAPSRSDRSDRMPSGPLRPAVFIGSSAEGLDAARAIQVLLDRSCEVEIWSQGTFGPGGGTLESLVSAVDRFDFAILIVNPDDTAISRGQQKSVPRDNVIFELGLFMGALGRERTFMVFDRTRPVNLPSADFHAASSTLVSGELVAESSVAPPGDGDGGEFGLA